MSIAQREAIKSALDWAVKLLIGLLAYLALTTFNDVRADIKEVGVEVGKVKTEVQSVRERMIRIETQMEKHE
jgi:hypothetical protein